MRLSNIPILLIHFFMFTFLTLLLKPNANAQTVSFAGNFTYNNYQRNRVSSGNTTDNYTNNVTDIPGADTEFTSVQAPLSFDFRRTSETFYLKLSAYHVLKARKIVYKLHYVILMLF